MGSADSDVPPPEHIDPSEWQLLPAEVYVPIESAPQGGTDVQLELRATGDGRTILPAYSTLQSLAAACGSNQPWIKMPSSRMPDLAGEVGFVTILADAALPHIGAEIGWSGVDADWLYAPSRPFAAGDEQAMLELQPVVGDQFALPVFTSSETLVQGCGPYQPWVSFRADRLEYVRQSVGAHVVYVNQALPLQVRHPGNDEVASNVTGTATDDEGRQV